MYNLDPNAPQQANQEAIAQQAEQESAEVTEQPTEETGDAVAAE